MPTQMWRRLSAWSRRESARSQTAGMPLAVAESSAALIEVASRHLGFYGAEKARHAVLDYGDQIAISRSLLARAGIAPWVLFKLDGGLDHLLIDEAQDTSPAQWAVIAALAEEFFAGEGTRAAPRTLFCGRRREAVDFQLPGRRRSRAHGCPSQLPRPGRVR